MSNLQSDKVKKWNKWGKHSIKECGRSGGKKKEKMEHLESMKWSGKNEYKFISNYNKCKWIKYILYEKIMY